MRHQVVFSGKRMLTTYISINNVGNNFSRQNIKNNFPIYVFSFFFFFFRKYMLPFCSDCLHLAGGVG